MPAAWSVQTLMGIPWTINSPVPGDSRLDNGTGGVGNFAIVDNNYINDTVTSLLTSSLDLSSATAVVLRFKSYYNYDFLESLNVDISTNGGTSWSNAWTFQGFNPFPTLYTLDLSGAVAGYANVVLRFRFDSEGWIDGDFWQVDDIELDVFGGGPPPGGDPPGQATGPSPANGGNGIGLNTNLLWSAGSLSTSHDVYFGTDSTPDVSEFQGNQAGTAFDPGTLANSIIYYWRIDEVNDDGTTTGAVWSFTTEAAPVPSSFKIAGLIVIGENVKGPRNRGVATITVQDADGSPVDGVAISGTFTGDWNGTRNGSTDSGGQLVLVTPAVKNGNLWLFCIDTASKAGMDFNASDSVAFLCDPPIPTTTGSIAGTVTDISDGTPIQGAAVSADSGQSDTTDAAGNYTLTDVPTGTRTVTFNATGYDSASPSTTVLDATTSTLDVSLTASPVGGGTGALKGTVKNNSGAKLSGALVQVIGGPSATTNKGGKYTIQNAPEGSQFVVASHPDYADTDPIPVTIIVGTTVTLDITFIP